jgi:hypothetical protein
MSVEFPNCDIPEDLIRFKFPLPNMARCIKNGTPVTIVAIGSSSTEGDGATDRSLAYPSRLEAILKLRFPHPPIVVHNMGKGGEEAADELARFTPDVLGQRPTLVVWQVGTNAAWKDYNLYDVASAIRTGLAQLSNIPADVVLMDLQYAPALLKKLAASECMVALIEDAATRAGVNLFRRFALMRHWNVDDKIPFDQMISNFDNNELHQNDWSYNCVAEALARAISSAIAGST